MKFLQHYKKINTSNRLLFLFTSVLIFGFTANGYSQITLDSIEKIRDTVRNPAKLIRMEMYLAEEFIDVDLSKSDKYFKIVESKLDTVEPIYVLRYYLAMSIREQVEGNPDLGIENAHKALEIAHTYKDSARYKAKIYNSLGSLYDDKSDIPKSIENHLIGLRYAESIDYKAQEATICNGIGRAYLYLPNYEKAKEYYGKAIAIKEDLGQFDISIASSYENLSICYNAENNYAKSLLYINKAMKIRKEHQNYIHLISTYNNKASTLLLLNRDKEALINAERSIHLADSFGVDNEKMFSLGTYAEILIAQNKIKEAEEAMRQSISLSKKRSDLYLIKSNLNRMYDINIKKGNYKTALDYYKQRNVVLGTINNLENRKLVEELVLVYETEKKNDQIEVLNKENEFSLGKLKKSKQLLFAFLIVALLLLTILGLLWSRHKNKIKTDKLIKEALERSYEKKLSDSEMQALRAQMNPHFLFNSLNSINSFIIKNQQEEASEYLSKFSMLIRKVLSNSKESKITLGNELEALELYLEMEALRVNNAFSYQINIGENVERDYLEIPPLIIQPYVENSIWHGLMHKTGGNGKLKINIKQDQETLICTIEDNGIGRVAAAKIKSESGIKQKSFGMNITKERLEYINEKFKDSSHVTVIDLKDSEGNASGTRVIIKIAI